MDRRQALARDACLSSIAIGAGPLTDWLACSRSLPPHFARPPPSPRDGNGWAQLIRQRASDSTICAGSLSSAARGQRVARNCAAEKAYFRCPGRRPFSSAAGFCLYPSLRNDDNRHRTWGDSWPTRKAREGPANAASQGPWRISARMGCCGLGLAFSLLVLG